MNENIDSNEAFGNQTQNKIENSEEKKSPTSRCLFNSTTHIKIDNLALRNRSICSPCIGYVARNNNKCIQP